MKRDTKAGRPGGSPGVVSGASLESGVSSHEQIKDSHDSLGMASGQGWRPKKFPSKSVPRGFKMGEPQN